MAINVKTKYPVNADAPSLSYPTGSFKNDTSPESEDGTPLEKDWANDFLGARDALLKRAGITASGDVETADASDVLDAIEFIVDDLSPGDASESQKGVIEIATSAEVIALTDDVRAVTPKKLSDVFKGASQSLTTSGYQKLPGGLVLQWGSNTQTINTTVTVDFPLEFPNACLQVTSTSLNQSGATNQDRSTQVGNFTTTGFDSTLHEVVAGGANAGVSWFAIGF